MMNLVNERATSSKWRIISMPFRLKNVGDTNQHHMNKVFKDLLGQPLEVYVNGTLSESSEKSHIINLDIYFYHLQS